MSDRPRVRLSTTGRRFTGGHTSERTWGKKKMGFYIRPEIAKQLRIKCAELDLNASQLVDWVLEDVMEDLTEEWADGKRAEAIEKGEAD